MAIFGQKYGTLNPNDWMEEGDGLLASSRTLRMQWLMTRRRLRRRLTRGGSQFRMPDGVLPKLTGAPRASLLLLGYAAEMYLKSGLVKLYHGCRDEMVQRDLRKFGHDYVGIAEEISFPLTNDSRIYLSLLTGFVTLDARYPIEPPAATETNPLVAIANSRNKRTDLEWNSESYSDLCDLVRSVKAHVRKLDSDSANPASFRRADLGRGGYIVMRYGGNLASRITYRSESDRRDARTLEEVRQLALDQGWLEATHYLDQFAVYEDGRKTSLIGSR